MRKQHRLRITAAFHFIIFVLAFGFATASPASAQYCRASLCRDGESYRPGGEDRDGPYGVCQSSSGLGYRSHYLAHCEEGWTLDSAAGVCVRDLCSGSVCGAQVPLCTPTERYSRGATDRDGAYGVCNHGPAPFTLAESHRLVRCGEGWSLIEETGACRRDCALSIDPGVVGPIKPDLPGVDPDRFVLRPDLVIARLWLRNASGAMLASVPAGSAYYICFEARNNGTVGSGSFKVRGGGLGIPTPPEQTQAGLSRGASREGCLFYPVTPRPGAYSVQVSADPDNAVVESNDSNNGRSIKVVIK